MRYQDIKWEDESDLEGESQKTGQKQVEELSFAELLQQESVPDVEIRRGSQVSGVISAISATSDNVLVELDAVHTGVMDKNQIYNEKGEQQYHIGDRITAYVVAYTQDEIQLSLRLSASKQSMEDLHNALHMQLPVRGKVTGENKGGFEITLMGKRCFCPVSQIDTRFVTNKTEFMGREFNFLIEKIEEGGRNIVVSRSKLLRKEAELKIAELEERKNQDQDIILDGIVTELRDYGAFIDLGGFDGFLHVSEMSYARVNRASDFLQKGDQVRVKLLKIETTNDGKRRISVSMKAIQEDPWATIGNRYETGKSYSGTVTRLETFGAFVSLEPGVEGLVHISEMSWEKRIHHPNEILKVGDKVDVRVVDIQNESQKLSLSLKNIEADPWASITDKFPVGAKVKGTVESLKGFGAFVQLVPGVTGLVPTEILKKAHGESYKKKASPPQELEVVIREFNIAERKILLSLPEIKDDSDDIQAYHEYMQSQQDKDKVKKETSKAPRGSFGDILAASLEGKKKS
ncbi:MAG TPA: S1 RNA-binding domain-containing protein [Oligoflexus sp.]|uniref:S1 RNA-binding domain-containing protein n=1 Tax=Oligoflexus sp. TaxID=1971216 RepID=UPI002D298FFA|nr:S1 RNA-binding domain-containing protein [Oligoflexus sp.]HYX37430.1 S1 RNA-binding domain-containing protein [Oligoflexus sp.]